MTNTEYYKNQAQRKAEIDFEKRLIADPSRHHALPKSAWATHYLNCYKRLQQLNKC